MPNRRDHGSTIDDQGNVRYLSVSSLDKGELCLRRWLFHYKFKIREDQNSAPLVRGTKGHAEIETFYETGVRSFSSNLMAGAFMLPPPGPDLHIERDIVPPDSEGGLPAARLTVAGIPMVGYIDLHHFRQENYGVREVGLERDEPGILKITDWKFPGNMDRAKTGDDLRDTYQMSGYGLWGFNTFPDVKQIRLSHGYFPSRGQPRMATTLVEREHVEKTWKRATSLAVSIRDAAKETNPDRVDANVRSCRAFNKDCPAKVAGRCTAADHNSLSMLLGPTAADRHLRNLPVLGATSDMSEQAPTSLVARLKAQGLAPVTPATPPPAMVAPVAALPQPAAVAAPSGLAAFAAPPSAAVAAEMARLTAQASTPPDPTSVLIHEILSYGFGFPQTSGSAAVAKAAAGDPAAGIAPYVFEASASNGLAGTGELAEFHIPDAVHFPQVLDEVKKMKVKREAEAQTPVVVNVQPSLEMVAPNVAVSPATTITNVVATSIEPVTAQTATTTTEMPAEAPKKGPGRPPGSKKKSAEPDAAVVAELATARAEVERLSAAASDMVVDYGQLQIELHAVRRELAAAQATPIVNNTVVQAAPVATIAPEKLYVYVDCLPDGVQCQSLWPLVYQIAEDLAKAEGILDIRLGDPNNKESRLAYNRWEGAVMASLRDAYSRGIIPRSGHFSIDGSMTKLGQVAVEAMKEIAYRNGGVIVRVTR